METIGAKLAQLAEAWHNCRKAAEKGNTQHYLEMACRHKRYAEFIVRETAPAGAGIDNGTTLILEESDNDKVKLYAPFHHMNESGFYTGWTQHTVTIRASLAFGIWAKASGPNLNDVKNYLEETYQNWAALGAEDIERRWKAQIDEERATAKATSQE